MGFDLAGLAAAVAAHGRVVRVVVASSAGSTPRETGASMLVWGSSQSGSIGGGALEWEAANRARAALVTGDRFDKVPLGPVLGQCCGGAVLLLTEVWDEARLASISGNACIRPMPGCGGEMPLKAVNRLRLACNGTRPLVTGQIKGWMVEPVSRAKHSLWVWGAGHVGRALVSVLSPLPDVSLRWVDVDRARFPETLWGDMTIAANPADLVPQANSNDHHLIVTYSHALDLDLCHRLLLRGFATCGLIGSATKWARFRGRLAALGHAPDAISRITCPIGDPALGKHPQAIAIGVAGALLARWQGVQGAAPREERPG